MITEAEYDVKLKKQKGVCAFCGNPPKRLRLAVDHNHKTGKVRGLLCFRCNKFVVGKFTLEMARRLVAYLRKYDG